MIVITNGTEYIYIDEQHQIQKTTDISRAKEFTAKRLQMYFILIHCCLGEIHCIAK